jgi:hypothetical protein
VRHDFISIVRGAALTCSSYGKDYLNDIFDFEIEAAGTVFQAPQASRDAVITLLQGDTWMIFRNTLTNVLHWDFVRGLAFTSNQSRLTCDARVS